MDLGLRYGDTEDAERAFRTISRDVDGHAEDAAADIARDVVKVAKGHVGDTGGSHPRSPGAIVFSEQRGEGGSVTLEYRRAPWIAGAEYGASRAWVFGRVTLQSRLRRRQFGTHVRDDLGGYMVGRAIRKLDRRMNDDAADHVQDEMGADLDRAGIRKV